MVVAVDSEIDVGTTRPPATAAFCVVAGGDKPPEMPYRGSALHFALVRAGINRPRCPYLRRETPPYLRGEPPEMPYGDSAF